MKRKYFFILALIFLCSINSIAQTSVVFAYDENGNRTSRSISVTQVQTKSDVDTTQTPDIEDLSVKIYPNPTKGILKVETISLPENSKILATIYDTQGNMICKKYLSQSDEVDISNEPDGIYILTINISTCNYKWKIVKHSR
jgi:hypothetical protein